MKIEIGTYQKQKEGFNAFIPKPFPPKGLLNMSTATQLKADRAARLIGKLDGITHDLPDVDFFLYMFVAKDAEASAQIEGTRATIVDALEIDAGVSSDQTDGKDILFYVDALNYGIERSKELPLSLRLVKEIHSKLMTGARCSQYSAPGEFRATQNWIGGTLPSNAIYVPPTVDSMNLALNDFEKFLHKENTLPIIQAALSHAQFEAIHPFLDGNGRTGRLLITILFYNQKMLEKPVLFLSSYFKKHQKVYYQKINAYHEGEVEEWVNFFLDGVIETAEKSINISKEIIKLREEDMRKIQALGKRESESGVIVLRNLFQQPIVNSKAIMSWTGFTRSGALKLLERFEALEILKLRAGSDPYDKSYVYRNYLRVFVD